MLIGSNWRPSLFATPRDGELGSPPIVRQTCALPRAACFRGMGGVKQGRRLVRAGGFAVSRGVSASPPYLELALNQRLSLRSGRVRKTPDRHLPQPPASGQAIMTEATPTIKILNGIPPWPVHSHTPNGECYVQSIQTHSCNQRSRITGVGRVRGC
jgi:hypothetical protein